MEFGATLDVDAVLADASPSASSRSRRRTCATSTASTADEFEILVAIGGDCDDDPAGSRYPLRDCSTFLQAAEQRRPVHCTDVLSDPSVTAAELDDARALGLPREPDVPLVSHGDVIGFISLMNRETRGFAREDVVDRPGPGRQPGDRQRRPLPAARRQPAAHGAGQRVRAGADQQPRPAGDAAHDRAAPVRGRRRQRVRDHRDRGRRPAHADARAATARWTSGGWDSACRSPTRRVTREVVETKRPAVVGSLRDPRLTPAVREIDKDCDAQELGDPAR